MNTFKLKNMTNEQLISEILYNMFHVEIPRRIYDECKYIEKLKKELEDRLINKINKSLDTINSLLDKDLKKIFVEQYKLWIISESNNLNEIEKVIGKITEIKENLNINEMEENQK